MAQDHTQFAVIIFCDESTDCDELDYYFTTKADTMIDIACEDDIYLHLKEHLLNYLV